MTRLDYAIHFFFGKKSDSMISIEERFPHLDKFDRLGSFFQAFGNHSITFKKGWIIIFPARHEFTWHNRKEIIDISISIFALYWDKTRNNNSNISKKTIQRNTDKEKGSGGTNHE